jgi:hypothetical protein
MFINYKTNAIEDTWERKEIVQVASIIILYKISLDFVYIWTISPIYAYQGFVYDFSLKKYFLSMTLVLLLLFPMIRLLKKGNTSSMILLLLSMVYFIPGCSIFALANLNYSFFSFLALYWISCIYLQLRLPYVRINNIRGNAIIFNTIIFIFAISSLVMSGVYTHFRINFDLSVIYDLRLEARNYDIPTFLMYIRNASTMIMPIGLIYYIVYRKRLLSITLIFIQVLEFSFAGKKSILFITFVAILIAMFYKEKHRKGIILAFFLMNMLVFAEFFLIKKASVLSKYIHRRVLFMPTLIASFYFDFFSNGQLLYLRQSILRWFGASSPYGDDSIQRLIGFFYFGDIENNANTGMLGDAFANFGWFALLFYPLGLVLLLRLIDICSYQINIKISALIWVLCCYKLINGSFFTVLLNGGVLIACLIIYCCPRDTYKMQLVESKI